MPQQAVTPGVLVSPNLSPEVKLLAQGLLNAPTVHVIWPESIDKAVIGQDRTLIDLPSEFLKRRHAFLRSTDFSELTTADWEEVCEYTSDWIRNANPGRRTRSWILAEKLNRLDPVMLQEMLGGESVVDVVGGQEREIYRAEDARLEVMLAAAAGRLAERQHLIPMFDSGLVSLQRVPPDGDSHEYGSTLSDAYALAYSLDGLTFAGWDYPAELILNEVVRLRSDHEGLFSQLFEVDQHLRTAVASKKTADVKDLTGERSAIITSIKKESSALRRAKRKYLVFGVPPVAAISAAIQGGDSLASVVTGAPSVDEWVAWLAAAGLVSAGSIAVYRWYLGRQLVGGVLADRGPRTWL